MILEVGRRAVGVGVGVGAGISCSPGCVQQVSCNPLGRGYPKFLSSIQTFLGNSRCMFVDKITRGTNKSPPPRRSPIPPEWRRSLVIFPLSGPGRVTPSPVDVQIRRDDSRGELAGRGVRDGQTKKNWGDRVTGKT